MYKYAHILYSPQLHLKKKVLLKKLFFCNLIE